jgi:mannose-1-phosphate guanylyltransferase
VARNSVFEHVYAVVMAGGSGTRFWPLSRRKHPKQLLELFGRGSLLEQTIARLRPLVPPRRIYVFTNELVWREVRRRLPEIPPSQIVAEPAACNTAPTLGVAAHEIARRDPRGLMVVLPSDHVIARLAGFRRALRAACEVASTEGRSVVLGLKPTRPETGFGYVRLGARAGRVAGNEIFRVEEFTEKPPLAVARRYAASGRYLWNGGMFIWRVSTLLNNFHRFQPRMARQLARLAVAGGVRARSSFRRLFPRLEKISVDYALMEKISGIFAVAADIGWNDVGSWAVVYDLARRDREGNVRPGRSLSLDSRGNLVVSQDGKFVVTVGARDLVIVDTRDALLVCARGRSQDVGRAVQKLERLGMDELL